MSLPHRYLPSLLFVSSIIIGLISSSTTHSPSFVSAASVASNTPPSLSPSFSPPLSTPQGLSPPSPILSTLIILEGARESWIYAIFWQSSCDYTGASVLGWGDGYYKGEPDKAKLRTKTSYVAEQEHRKRVLRELNSLISGSASGPDDAIDEELTDTEWFFLVSMTLSFFVNSGGLPSDLGWQAEEVTEFGL